MPPSARGSSRFLASSFLPLAKPVAAGRGKTKDSSAVVFFRARHSGGRGLRTAGSRLVPRPRATPKAARCTQHADDDTLTLERRVADAARWASIAAAVLSFFCYFYTRPATGVAVGPVSQPTPATRYVTPKAASFEDDRRTGSLASWSYRGAKQRSRTFARGRGNTQNASRLGDKCVSRALCTFTRKIISDTTSKTEP